MIDPRLEAEYNNRGKVPEHPALIEGWVRDAAAFRASHPKAELGVPYTPGERTRLDIFWPDADDPPMAMFIHGGYWAALDRSFVSHLARGFVGRGIALAVPSYDLCPTVPLAAIVAQMRGAAAFLVRRTGRPVFAAGHSAGGHLAAMLLAARWAEHGLAKGAVSGAFAVSGLFDLRPLVPTSINGPLGLDAAQAADLSPALLPPPGRPIAAHVGALEGGEYHDQSRSIAEAWGGQWATIPGANHFTAIAPLADPASALMQAVMDTMGRAGG